MPDEGSYTGEAPAQGELKRGLGFFLVFMLSFSTIMGSGMYFGAAMGAKYGGPASLLAWPLITMVALYIAACFAELTSIFPRAGGIYEFCKQAYGRFPSFFVGWVGWITSNFGNTIVVVAGLDYLLPQSEYTLLKIGLSIIIIVLLNLITYFGVEASGKVVMALVLLTIATVAGIIVFGALHFEPARYLPFAPNGYLPVAILVFFLIESFSGWESVTYMAEETKNPERTIPKALILGTLAVGIASMAVHAIAFGVVGWSEILGSPAPLSLVFSRIFPAAMELPLRIVITLTLMGAAAGGIVGLPRLLLALARDRLFLTQMAAVHPVRKTPYKAIMFQTIASIGLVLATMGRYERLLSLFVPLALLLYSVTVLAVPVLRRKYPAMVRPFSVPLGRIGPYLIAFLFISLTIVWVIVETNAFSLLALGGSLVLLGLPLYLLIELYYDPQAITSVRDLTAHFGLLTEGLFFPKAIQKEIFSWLGDLGGKFVLEFGCGVGTLTLKLAEAVGPGGEVFATDISLNELKIVKRRLLHEMWRSTNLTHGRVQVLHDPQHMEHVHPVVKYADAAVSFGVMSYIQDVPGVLHELSAVLPEGGKICFVEYVDFFRVLPNPEWLSDNKKIEEMFRSNGFSVRVARKRSFLWNYVYLYGIKSRVDVPVV